jgi:hypothetical protein
LKHTNELEVKSLAAVLDRMGFAVDVIDHLSSRAVRANEYDLLVGFGLPMLRALATKKPSAKTIAYATGMHHYVQNTATIQRVQQVHSETGAWLIDSARYVETDWSGLARLADAVTVLGNEAVRSTFVSQTNRPVYVVPAPIHILGTCESVVRRRNVREARSHFLFTSGSGLVHKGLDLVLRAFDRSPDVFLTVMANVEAEPSFKKLFHKHLYQHDRIRTMGYVPLDSPRYPEALTSSCFIISPSCSEGGGAATLNAMGNGACIPVVTKGASIDTCDFGVEIKATTVAEVYASLMVCSSFSDAEITRRSDATARHCLLKHSTSAFEEAIMRVVDATLAG